MGWLQRWREPRSLTVDPSVFVGHWVAVYDGQVLAFAPTAKEIMDKLHLNHATIWFEEHPDKVQKWAILEENGRIGPNCFFDTQDQARRWRDSWGHGTLVTRSGQHGKWIPVPDEQE